MSEEKWMYYCRVCGLDQGEPIWGETNKSPTYFICDCCGTEFGIEDENLTTIKKHRDRWLLDPEKWWRPKDRPDHWDYKEQMKNIPKQYL
jgi:hypothetical protein